MLRNREFKKFIILFSIISAIFIVLSFNINILGGLLAVVCCVSFATIFFVFTKKRYKRISEISEEIDLVLHNPEHIFMEDLEEGELSILHSEINKMLLRIREQNVDLKKEKEHLADSLADIAHQLRTPLTSANIILSLLINESDEKERKSFIRETEDLLLQMDWLITSLLKLSRLDAGVVVFQQEQINVNELINAALRPILIPMELHNIAVNINVNDNIKIYGDFNWLSEAIRNIFKNSMESIGNRGNIEIFCEGNLLFTEILIHDSGHGFEKETLTHIFDRFYCGNSQNATGYGIGLALCKMIITRQGGTIIAKNHPQGGAIFTIRFTK